MVQYPKGTFHLAIVLGAVLLAEALWFPDAPSMR
jgi:hypothetical protein